LLEAFKVLRRDYPNLKLTIAGSEHIRFPNYANQLKLQLNHMDGIRWLGQTSEDDVMELFRRAQIVVLPYRASTGSSSVIYQAATWGRAVVASNLNEIKELVDENNLQVEFFENGDAQSLYNSIHILLDSKEKRNEQVSHNFNAIQHTRPHETCRNYIQAFNRALKKRRSPKRIAIPMTEKNPA